MGSLFSIRVKGITNKTQQNLKESHADFMAKTVITVFFCAINQLEAGLDA